MKLFSGGVNANDIAQGQLGDCWLMATIAAIADVNGHIEHLFLTREVSKCGYYKIKLYDIFNESAPKWTVVTIDDRIPVATGTTTPLFAKPSGRELWVLLLEKAFAKLMGSYYKMDGGHPAQAMRVFTGNSPVRYARAAQTRDGKQADWWTDASWSAWGPRTAPDLAEDNLWNVINAGVRHDMVMSAFIIGGSGQGKEAKLLNGLIGKHAYTVIDTCHSKVNKLIKLRNPWGTGEWTGAYSDKDTDPAHKWDSSWMTWRGKMEDKDDGCFWMPWSDFVTRFDNLDICAVSSSMGNLELDLNEDIGMCGPCVGCLEGFKDFCLLCKGTRHLWCSETRTTHEMLNAFKNGQGVWDKVTSIQI